MKDNLVPNHIGIIMDGNGRWAKNKGKKRSYGHLMGSKTLKKIAPYIFKKGVRILSVFAFSTENFKRSSEEVNYLMNLFIKMFTTDFNVIMDLGIKIVFSKCESGLPNELEKLIKEMENKTKNNNNGIFNICINYSGRREIVDSVKKICFDVEKNKLNINDISEEIFQKYLYNDLEPIDLLIRTSGEYRISNFMLWQLSYAEMYFPNVYFPDFNEKEFDKAIVYYNNRDRRFGGINEK